MLQIVEINEEGDLYLPSDLLLKVVGTAKPHTRYALEAKDGGLVLTHLEQMQPFWARSTPEERARAFHYWATGHKSGAGLADEWVKRDTMYD